MVDKARYKTLKDKLTKKMNDWTIACIDAHLREKGEPFFEGYKEYDSSQRFLARDEVTFPAQLNILREVLKNINYPISQPANVDNNDFPVFHFLNALLEIKDDVAFLDTLVTGYDLEYPTYDPRDATVFGISKDDYFQNCEVYLGVKRAAVEGLLSAFRNRGIAMPRHGVDSVLLSHSMTESRYNYLAKVAEAFFKDPESEEVIGFVEQLPSNTWGDSTTILYCDSPAEFKALEKKYVKERA